MTLHGDINQDGKVDKEDLAILRTMVKEHPELLENLNDEQKKIFDLDGDGNVGYDDVVTLINKLANNELANSRQMTDSFQVLRQKFRG